MKMITMLVMINNVIDDVIDDEMLSAAEIMVRAMVTAIIYNNKVLCYDIQQ